MAETRNRRNSAWQNGYLSCCVFLLIFHIPPSSHCSYYFAAVLLFMYGLLTFPFAQSF
ncbi:hypothetical protein HOLleu_19496 [Holothuria leucospilota]|uniref:Uncharacterized protein n=1 Tax=Holothuria leucospilota TaxID=206669 RepID=A0A9Q1H7Y7_HOLLE|nr:hypothetical protein HOLleu_19496 [Holothuria leucospilota]